MPKRILIAEDEDSVRGAMRKFIESRSQLEVCEAVDGEEALHKAATLNPNLIVLDLRMPKANGIEVAAVLHARTPGTPIVIFTMFEDKLGASLTKVLGIAAVVPKTDGVGKLLGCIEALLDAQDALSRSHQAAASSGYRDPLRLLPNPIPGQREFCVCRVRVGCALTTIESFDTLLAAQNFMSDIAASAPGSYVVFSQTTRQVLAKTGRDSS